MHGYPNFSLIPIALAKIYIHVHVLFLQVLTWHKNFVLILVGTILKTTDSGLIFEHKGYI